MTRLPESDLDHILFYTKDLWKELCGARLFITGGTGFFGKWILETLNHVQKKLNVGFEALVLSRNPEAFLNNTAPHLRSSPWLQFAKGDVSYFKFPEGAFTHVIHAATPASAKLNRESPLQMFTTNLEGTKRVLEFAKQSGVCKLLFTSSGAVYGKQPSDVTHLAETDRGGPDPLNALSAYAEGKRAAELLCSLFAKTDRQQNESIEVKIARCFAFIGPHLPLDSHFAIGNFIKNRLHNESIHILGDGTSYRSYLYVSDLMIWLFTIFFRGISGCAYNVGSEESVTIAELANRVLEASMQGVDVIQSKPQILIEKPTLPGALPERYVPSTKRAQAELGLKVWVPLNEAILKTLNWYREQHENTCR